jgi:hypothetical protein
MDSVAPRTGIVASPPPPCSRFVAGLEILRAATAAAKGLGKDAWEFAVEIGELRAAGLSHTDLRWLACSDLVAHAYECPPQGNGARQFRAPQSLYFSPTTCFVLTANGSGFLKGCARTGFAEPGATTGGEPAVPLWDGPRRELTWQGLMVKRFRQPAGNQELLLAAWEEEGWRARIEDPLPPSPGVEPKSRLRDALKALNQRQVHPVLRFRGDGTGCGALWEAMADEGKLPSRLPRCSP